MDKKGFPIWSLLYKNLALIIIATILFGCFGYVFSRYTKSESYTATKKIIVSASFDATETTSTTKSSSSAVNNVTLAELILPTVSTAFTSNEANEIINKFVDINYSSEKSEDVYSGSIGFSFSESSLICSLSYTSGSKSESAKKLDYVINGFSFWLSECEKQGIKIVSTGTISIMSVQKTPSISSSSPYLKDGVLYAVIGCMVAFVFIIVRYLLDTKITDEQEVIDITGEGVLAFIEKY